MSEIFQYLLSPFLPFWKTYLGSSLISQDALSNLVKNEENFLDENPQCLVTQNHPCPLSQLFHIEINSSFA